MATWGRFAVLEGAVGRFSMPASPARLAEWRGVALELTARRGALRTDADRPRLLGDPARLARAAESAIVLSAAREDRTPTDADLGAEVTAMRSDAELFTRVALGSGESTGTSVGEDPGEESIGDVYGGSVRWYQGE